MRPHKMARGKNPTFLVNTGSTQEVKEKKRVKLNEIKIFI